MPSRTFASNKSSLFADGSSNLGGGADQHMPVGGPYGGYTFRSAVRFALDFSSMKRIDSAVLRLKTSSQVHVAFSSDPDIYIARATADWTANGSSGSSDGGSGWGTSPTVYPGPSSTSTNRVTRDITTSESAWVEADITGIVRDWLNGQPNYGLLLYYVASGDITEFVSYRGGSGNRPEIVVTYATDTAPSATLTGPTGVQATTRPTISGTASDPDGDPITNVGIAVYRASDNVLVYYADIGAFGVFDHVPTSDLPGGALWAAATPTAGGLTGPSSNQITFTVDRPPTVVTPYEPAGASSNRRPTLGMGFSDPDGDPATLFDFEVYATSGGAPAGSPVYTALNLTTLINPASVHHVPTVDLPGGPLVVRGRVRSGPASLWSSWSGYQPFTVALTTPTVAWIEPVAPNAFEELDPPTFANPNANLLTTAIWGRISDAPPSGQTLTREARGYGYDTAGAGWAYDGPPQAPNTPAGGISSQPIYVGPGGSTPYGRGHYRFIVGSSGGGTVDTQRNFRSSALEWYGVVFLGDNVTAITAALAGLGGQVHGWIRAQGAKNAITGPWRELTDTAALIAELPAQGAYLGLKARFAINALDVDCAYNGSFEIGASGMDGWRNSAGAGVFYTQRDAGSPEGDSTIAVIVGPTTGWMTAANDGAVGNQLVIPGATYTLSGWLRAEGSNVFAGAVGIHMYAPGTFAYAGKSPTALTWPAGTSSSVWTQKTAQWVCPVGVGSIALEIMIQGAAGPSEYKCFDALKLVGPKPGAAGLDKWTIDWTSAG